MKVILNKRYGGFGVSQEAYELYAKKKGIELFAYKLEIVSGKPIYKKTDTGSSQYSLLLLQRTLEIILIYLMIISANIA